MRGSTDRTGIVDIEHLRSWIGREEQVRDNAAPGPLAGLAALLDHDAPLWAEGEVPPLAHWLYFLPRVRQSELGEDGHPQRGGFLPPVPLPRRMWAGGGLRFHRPIRIGAAIERVSTIADVTAKTGASGEMVFVTVPVPVSDPITPLKPRVSRTVPLAKLTWEFATEAAQTLWTNFGAFPQSRSSGCGSTSV